MKCTSKQLTWACLVFGAVSVITLSLAVSTDRWIFTRERHPLDGDLPTMVDTDGENFGNDTEIKPTGLLVIDSHIGLWRICGVVDEEIVRATGTNPCIGIIYEDDYIEGRIENQASSGALTRAIRPAAPMVVLALLFVLIGAVFSVAGNLKRDVKVLIAAVFYILAGLSLAVGIVLYISAINDEVGHISKKPDSEEVVFQYHYGWSFYMAGAGFISAEIAAVFSVSLYLKRYSTKKELLKILPGLQETLDSQTLVENSSPLHSPTLIL